MQDTMRYNYVIVLCVGGTRYAVSKLSGGGGGGGLLTQKISLVFHAFKFTLKQYNNDILFVAFVSVRYMYMQNRACLILVKSLTIQIKGERGGGGQPKHTRHHVPIV